MNPFRVWSWEKGKWFRTQLAELGVLPVCGEAFSYLVLWDQCGGNSRHLEPSNCPVVLWGFWAIIQIITHSDSASDVEVGVFHFLDGSRDRWGKAYATSLPCPPNTCPQIATAKCLTWRVQREGEKCQVIPFSLSWEVRMPYNIIWILLVLKDYGILWGL